MMDKPLLRYGLVFAAASFAAYMVDAWVINLTGFVVGGIAVDIYRRGEK